MSYKVFISHSTADLNIVQQFHYWMQVNGIDAFLAELYPQAGNLLSQKISGAIEQCDCVIAFLTQDGTRSQWVHQEIGYAHKAGKLIIPIVEEGVPTTGFVKDVEYISFRKDNPTDAINKVTQYLVKLKTNKEENEMALAGLLILLGLFALSASKK